MPAGLKQNFRSPQFFSWMKIETVQSMWRSFFVVSGSNGRWRPISCQHRAEKGELVNGVPLHVHVLQTEPSARGKRRMTRQAPDGPPHRKVDHQPPKTPPSPSSISSTFPNSTNPLISVPYSLLPLTPCLFSAIAH